jgi:hypothetical protein
MIEVKEVIGLISFVLMLIVSWCFLNSKDDDLLVCIKRILRIKQTPKDTNGVPDDIKDTPDDTKKCEFEAEDIYNGRIHAKDGTLITSQPNMTCADCTKYIYKDNDGKCYTFVHDPEYNADSYCAQEQKEEKDAGDPFVTSCNDMCTAQFTPTKCTF